MADPQELVDLETLKRHLGLDGTGTVFDTLLETLLTSATDVVLGYLARPEDEDWTATIASWTDETLPPRIAAAILMQAAEMYGYRGDSDGPTRDVGDLSPMIKAVLRRDRRPVLS